MWYTALTISVKITAPVGPDGALTVAVPTPLRETDIEVMLVVQPVAATTEGRGWPPAFSRQRQAAGRGSRWSAAHRANTDKKSEHG